MTIRKLTAAPAQDALALSVRRNRQRIAEAAQTVASGNGQPAGNESFNRALLEARLAANQIDASAKALERVNDTLGQFIDTRV